MSGFSVFQEADMMKVVTEISVSESVHIKTEFCVSDSGNVSTKLIVFDLSHLKTDFCFSGSVCRKWGFFQE